MSDHKYKYRINELMQNLCVTDYRKAMRIIPGYLGISSKTFANYRNIEMYDQKDIPHEKVDLLEKLFNLNSGELQNFTWKTHTLTEIDETHIYKPEKVIL